MNEQTPPSARGNSPASRDIATLVHPYTNLKQHPDIGPLIVTRGDGIRVFDETGKEYIEAMAGLWCTSLGFGEKRLVEAATKALETLPFYHQFTHKSHMPGIELAEALLDRAPVPMSKVFFGNSGSEVNDTAMKLVWYYHNAIGKPEKKKIISRIKAYHGVTIATASLTGLPANHGDFDLPIDRVLHTNCPHFYWEHQEGEDEEAFATRCAESLEALILEEGPETIGAMIAEPIMGAGGVIVPPETYFPKIQAVLKKYDILLIADEVICGFCRTGNFWGSETYGIEPDMMSMAKALSSAYLPISALLINEKVWQGMVEASDRNGVFGHGYTYSGHPVAAAVALETQKLYDEFGVLDHVRSVMAYFQESLTNTMWSELVGEVRGKGLIAGIELVKHKNAPDTGRPARFAKAGVVGTAFRRAAEEEGLIVRNIGDTIAICPPLIITKDEIDEMVQRFKDALAKTEDWVAANKPE